jgi:transcription elongation factor Elf1
MTNTRYIVTTVECPRCNTKQKIHVALGTRDAQEISEMIRCLNCNSTFKVTLPDRFIRGPFPA